MSTKAVIGFALITTLVGCASLNRTPTPVNQLQIKVAQLERKLDEKEREIADLKYEIDDLSEAQREATDNFNSADAIESYNFEEPTFVEPKATRTSSKEDKRIIRVAADAKTVQNALKSAGYYNGSIDGKIGSGSKRAIKNFQKDHDLVSDGIIGRKTWNQLKTYLQ